MQNNTNITKTKIIVQTALFIAIALVLRNFSYMVYMGGGAGMRLGVAGFFTKLPALLFGPVYGGLCPAIVDLLGYVIKPEGAYIFPLTVTAFAGGVLTGVLYRLIKNKPTYAIKRIYLCVTFAIGIFGIFNHICYAFYQKSFWGEILNSFGTKVSFFIIGFYAISIVGLIFYAVDMFIMKKYKKPFMEDFLKLFIVFFIADILVTTANTYILMIFIPALSKLGFWIYYLPRLAQEIFSVFISSYAVSYLLQLAKKVV